LAYITLLLRIEYKYSKEFMALKYFNNTIKEENPLLTNQPIIYCCLIYQNLIELKGLKTL